MKKRLIGATAFAAFCGATGAAQAEFTLNILHINDFHSRFESVTASDSTCNAEGESKGECFGGIGRLRTAIEAQRAQFAAAGENSVLLNAGDNFQGSLYYTTYKSKVVSDFLNQMGFDVAATGNHEFDDGPEEFAKFVTAATFPVLGGNFDVSKLPDLATKVKGTHVLEINGEKIGVVGATTEETPDIAAPGPDITWQPATEWVKSAVADLEAQGINKIILLSHLGFNVDQNVAAQVAGIDLIVGGHTHTLLSNTDPKAAGPYPSWVANPDGVQVPIVTAFQYGRLLGDVKVTWDDDGNLTAATGEPIVLDKSVTPDATFAAELAELGKPLEELKAKVIGTATAAIEGSREVCRVEECAMGSLIADAILDRTRDQGTQIAFQNGGGVRSSIDQGEITMGEVLTVLPFSNTLATFQLKGSDVVAALENGVSDVENGAGRFPQVAGLRYTWDRTKAAGSRIVSAEVQENGQWVPVDPAKTYNAVTNNYVRNGGDGYAMFAGEDKNAYDFGPALEDVLADYIAKQGGSITPATDGRISLAQ